MSKRRHEGEGVWLAERGGCIGSEKVRHATVHDKSWMGCVYECGDDDCVEWNNVQGDDGSWSYHVTECDMFDTEAEAVEASRSHPMPEGGVKSVVPV